MTHGGTTMTDPSITPIFDPVDPDDGISLLTDEEVASSTGRESSKNPSSIAFAGKAWDNGRGGVAVMIQAQGGWHRRLVIGAPAIDEDDNAKRTVDSLVDFFRGILDVRE